MKKCNKECIHVIWRDLDYGNLMSRCGYFCKKYYKYVSDWKNIPPDKICYDEQSKICEI